MAQIEVYCLINFNYIEDRYQKQVGSGAVSDLAWDAAAIELQLTEVGLPQAWRIDGRTH